MCACLRACVCCFSVGSVVMYWEQKSSLHTMRRLPSELIVWNEGTDGSDAICLPHPNCYVLVYESMYFLVVHSHFDDRVLLIENKKRNQFWLHALGVCGRAAGCVLFTLMAHAPPVCCVHVLNISLLRLSPPICHLSYENKEKKWPFF